MTVKLGTNPIAWSNDDMPELGGDTPLETCLREAPRGRFHRDREGQQVPRTTRMPCKAVLGQLRAGVRLRLVQRRTPHAHGRGRDQGDAAPSRPAKACGCKVMVFAETSGTVQGRRDVPVADRPIMSEDEWPGYPRADRQARRLHGRQGRRSGLPPPHGHGDREGRRGRPAAGGHARHGRPAVRHRPLHLRRRRPGRRGEEVGEAHQPRPHQGRPPRCAEAGPGRALELPRFRLNGVYTVPGDGCIDFEAALRPSPKPATAAGSSARPSRTPPRPIP